MPRTGKGGKREGSSQTAYSNRTDLANRGPQPITSAPGEPYGQRQMLEDAQRAIPMAGVQTPTPSPTGPQNAPQVPQNAPQMPHVEPGTIPFTEPPTTPLPFTHGLPYGPGAGPEVLPMMPQEGRGHLAQMLAMAARHPTATPEIRALAEIARHAQL
jgi:hypothetical protein